MLRERDDYAVSGPRERDDLCRTGGGLSALGIEGLVLGFIRGQSDGAPAGQSAGVIDLETTLEVLAAAPGLQATFHHAFDDLGDPIEALAGLKTCGRIDHVLTRGRDVEGRAAWLRAVAHRTWPQISVIVGGGVDASVIRELRREASIAAFHVGRAARVPESAVGCVSATKVRALRELLESEIQDV
jgi:copper homeostasis protein